METYLVGGAVRDELLGREVVERDWVVVGATPAELEALGYRQVGRDFPVFLHPDSAEEYALARTERKTGPGHTGFVCHAGPDVTLEDDLSRRDLTVNAMARDPSGTLIDPFGGARDVTARVLRHVSAAFVEDPLRVFRVARFAGQLPGFEVAPETQALMLRMAADDALSELSAERVWRELHKALESPAPERFFEVLDTAAALAPWLLELEGRVIRFPTALDDALVRFGYLAGALDPDAARALCVRLRAPRRFQRLAEQLARCGPVLRHWPRYPAPTLLAALEGIGVFSGGRDPEPAFRVLAAEGVEPDRLRRLAERLAAVTAAEFQAQGLRGPAIGEAMRAARLEQITAALAGD